MRRDIRKWYKECPDCQASKIHRHTRSSLVERLPPSDRFCNLHVDLVGPLPESQGIVYMFTIIDRFTRWSEAIPLPNAHASACATALLHHWIARFGVPEDITSDRGRQFTSSLWTQLNALLGIHATTTTAYHPEANGMVERLHRKLKASLKARTTAQTGLMNSPWCCWEYVPLAELILVVHLPNLFTVKHSAYQENSYNQVPYVFQNPTYLF